VPDTLIVASHACDGSGYFRPRLESCRSAYWGLELLPLMTRGKAPREILDRREQDKMPLPKASSDHFLRRAKTVANTSWKSLVFLATVLGVVSGWVAMIPKISVSQSQPLDPNDPFSTPFVVSSDGPLPIENVKFFCTIHTLTTTGASVIGETGNLFTSPMFNSPEMSPGERATVPCTAPPMTHPFTGGDVSIVVRFRVGYTPIRTSGTSRFIMVHANDGHLYWYPEPARQEGTKQHIEPSTH
jgi:hypothetical protein